MTHLIHFFIWFLHTDLKDGFCAKLFSELKLLDLKYRENCRFNIYTICMPLVLLIYNAGLAIELLPRDCHTVILPAHTQSHLKPHTFPPYNRNFIRLQRRHFMFDRESNFLETLPLLWQLLHFVVIP